jgi:hypothetical protein
MHFDANNIIDATGAVVIPPDAAPAVAEAVEAEFARRVAAVKAEQPGKSVRAIVSRVLALDPKLHASLEALRLPGTAVHF